MDVTNKKITRGEVSSLLAGKNSTERSGIKAREVSKIKLNNFTQRGIEVEIISGPMMVRGMVEIIVEAKKDGKDLYVDNPLYFKNPPIMVGDGTFHEVESRNGTIHSPNLVEDPKRALETAIIDVLEVLNK